MFSPEAIDDLADEVRRVLGDVDADSLLGSDALRCLRAVSAIERRAAAPRLALVRRVAETGAWRHRGHSSPADAVAAAVGCSPSAAKRMLGTAGAIAAQPALGDALANGDVSESQADTIAPATKADPASTEKLIDNARRGDHRATKTAADKVIDRATATEQRRRRAWRNRNLCTTTRAATGEATLSATGPAEAIAAIVASVDALARDLQAGRTPRQHPTGGPVTWPQRRFDALASLTGAGHLLRPPPGETAAVIAAHTATSSATDNASDSSDSDSASSGSDVDDADDADTDAPPAASSSGTRGRPMAVVDLDLSAWATDDPATAHVEGLGPVPASFAQQILDDPDLHTIVQIIIRDGVDPRRIVHFSRRIPPELRAAMRTRDGACATPQCPGYGPTEFDHDPIPFDGGRGAPTALATGKNRCKRCHRLKTYEGHTLYGEPGNRVATDAHGTILTTDQPDHPPLDQLKAAHAAATAALREQIRLWRATTPDFTPGDEPPTGEAADDAASAA